MDCNRVAVENDLRTVTQGSSRLATLGFETESLWDSQTARVTREADEKQGSNSTPTLRIVRTGRPPPQTRRVPEHQKSEIVPNA